MSTDAGTEQVAWVEVRVDVPTGWQELVATELEGLEELAGASAVIGHTDPKARRADAGLESVRVFVEHPRPDLAASIARCLADLARRTGVPELAQLDAELIAFDERDWGNWWQESWRPFRIGRLCVLTPEDPRPLRPDDIPVRLVPGGVFGTGRHVTTRSCLRGLQERVRPGTVFLDAGTGTGLLGVAAALLGAKDVHGFDVDPASLVAARHLAQANGVGARCSFTCAGFERDAHPPRSFDGLAANIYADVLIAQLATLAHWLRRGGWFLLSGIAARHLDAVLEALAKTELELEEIRGRKWKTVVGIRPA